jgi:hypothetical protein
MASSHYLTAANSREMREHFEPSNPLMAGGANVKPLLVVCVSQSPGQDDLDRRRDRPPARRVVVDRIEAKK